jgi:hypothetical protein
LEDPLEKWKVFWGLSWVLLYAVHFTRMAASWSWLAWLSYGALASLVLATVVIGATWLRRWGNGG